MASIILTFLSFSALATAIPQQFRLSSPPSVADPYRRSIPELPQVCYGDHPLEVCLEARAKGGYLHFDSNSSCSSTRKHDLEEALRDALSFAAFAATFPDLEHGNGPFAWQYYMGPNYDEYFKRIQGNLKRVASFQNMNTYITMRCEDGLSGVCRKSGVGGYARSDHDSARGYFHYISFCPPFFGVESLQEKKKVIQQDLNRGNYSKAEDMRYLRTRGDYFLHEMMHLHIANGNEEPHITDEFVAPIPKGETPGRGDHKAYGPARVHQLAIRRISSGGGAARSSTNADSYSMLANALWWCAFTDTFPGVPGKDGSLEDEHSLIFLHLDSSEIPSNITPDDPRLWLQELATYAD